MYDLSRAWYSFILSFDWLHIWRLFHIRYGQLRLIWVALLISLTSICFYNPILWDDLNFGLRPCRTSASHTLVDILTWVISLIYQERVANIECLSNCILIWPARFINFKVWSKLLLAKGDSSIPLNLSIGSWCFRKLIALPCRFIIR